VVKRLKYSAASSAHKEKESKTQCLLRKYRKSDPRGKSSLSSHPKRSWRQVCGLIYENFLLLKFFYFASWNKIFCRFIFSYLIEFLDRVNNLLTVVKYLWSNKGPWREKLREPYRYLSKKVTMLVEWRGTDPRIFTGEQFQESIFLWWCGEAGQNKEENPAPLMSIRAQAIKWLLSTRRWSEQSGAILPRIY
jgi:hypothetical protein